MTDKELKQAMDEVQDAMRQEGLTESVSFFDGDITKPVSFAIEEKFMSTIPLVGGFISAFGPVYFGMELKVEEYAKLYLTEKLFNR